MFGPDFDWRALPVTARGVVQVWECDFMGHMNVMHYVGKFDEATWQLVLRLGLTRDYLLEKGVAMAAVQQNLTYLREMLAGEALSVHSGVREVRERVLHFEHVMTHDLSGEVAARCEMKAVHVHGERREAIPLPDFVADRAAPLMVEVD